jgi:hypothetical protein
MVIADLREPPGPQRERRVQCHKHQTELGWYASQGFPIEQTSIIINIQPCPDCIKEAYAEGYRQGFEDWKSLGE